MHWFWTKKPAPPAETEQRDILRELQELRREVSSLRVEWEEWYDKYRTLYARISRRAERLQALEASQEAPRTADPTQTDIQWAPERQRIQEEVLQRRRGNAVPRQG